MTSRYLCPDAAAAVEWMEMKSHKITATGYEDLKRQLDPWRNDPTIRILTPAGDVARVLTIALQADQHWQEENSKPADWRIDLTLHYEASADAKTSPP
jgi:hypothetical protein